MGSRSLSVAPALAGTQPQRQSVAMGGLHQQVRKALLDAFIPGMLCGFCDLPMLDGQPLDLDHSNPALKGPGVPGDRLTHTACNRRTNVRDIGTAQRSCEICGAHYKGKHRQRTCGRACGWELRRRNAEAA